MFILHTSDHFRGMPTDPNHCKTSKNNEGNDVAIAIHTFKQYAEINFTANVKALIDIDKAAYCYQTV